jgi:KDO2-lipid IV(A) lauroyltransferase
VAKIGVALTVLLLRALAVLPYGLVARFGHSLGSVLFMIPSRRKKIVLVNLRLCFPAKSEPECQELAQAHFRQVVRSYLERGVQWFGSERKIRKLVQMDGNFDQGGLTNPVIYLGFHFVAIEVGCMMYSTDRPIAALYTRMSNSRLCEVVKGARGRFGAEMIERGASARQVIGLLRTGMPVMLAADMDHGMNGSVFAPFFGVQACTLTSVSRMARVAHARVVPFVTEVLPDFKGYKLTIFDAWQDFPSGDDLTDASRMNAFLETQIKRFPEQYYWVHRRFKHRPPGMAPVY